MNLPRFTLRDMFLATTLIAVGIGGATYTIRYGNAHHNTTWGPFEWAELELALLACSATIGAGIFTPFHRKRLGAIVGICATMAMQLAGALILELYFYNSRHR